MDSQDMRNYRWSPKSERHCYVHPFLRGTIWWEDGMFACYLLPLQTAGHPNAKFLEMEDAENFMADNQHIAIEADRIEVKQY